VLKLAQGSFSFRSLLEKTGAAFGAPYFFSVPVDYYLGMEGEGIHHDFTN